MDPPPIKSTHLRLLITFDDEKNPSTTIRSRKFVYGLDLERLPTILDILKDLRSKLLINDSNSTTGDVGLELFLKPSSSTTTIDDEYFLPPWSKSREVLNRDDELVLKFRKSDDADGDDGKSAIINVGEGDRIDSDEVMGEQERKKKKKKKKRKMDESSAATIPDVPEPIEPEPVQSIKKKKKKKKKHRSPESVVNIEEKSSTSPTAQTNDKSPPSNSDDLRPRRKKPKLDDPHRAIVVARNERTGSRHIRFDSSPIAEEEDQSSTTAAVQQQQESSSSTVDIPSEPPPKTKKVYASRLLERAKNFTALIDRSTTCENLDKALDDGTGQKDSAMTTKRSVLSFTPIVVTKNFGRQGGDKSKGQGKNRYSNVSILVEKAAPKASSISTTREENDSPSNRDDPTRGKPASMETEPVKFKFRRSTNGRDAVGAANSEQTAAGSSTQADSQVNGRIPNGQSADSSSTPIRNGHALATTAGEPPWTPSRPIAEYPLIKHPGSLRVGDKLAYKIMELDETDCTPGISDWKIGRLEEFDQIELELRVKLVLGEARCEVPWKFRFIDEEEENGMEIDGDGEYPRMPEVPKVQEDVIHWREIIEARLLNE